MTPIRRWRGWRRLRAGEWSTDEGVAIGFSRKGELVRVPIAGWRCRHGARRRRDRLRQDDPDAAAGARRDQARLGGHLHRSQGRRLRARAAARGRGASTAAVPAMGAAGRRRLQPVRPGIEHRDRRQAAGGRGLHRAALPAARSALSRARHPRAQARRRGGQPRHRRRAHAPRTAGQPHAQDVSRRRPAAA